MTAATRCPSVKNLGWTGCKGEVDVDSTVAIGVDNVELAIGVLAAIVDVVVNCIPGVNVGVLVEPSAVGDIVDRVLVLTGVFEVGTMVGSISDSGTIAIT